MASNSKSLAERLAQEFSSSAPIYEDPEDYVADESSAAQILDQRYEDSEDDNGELGSTNLRRHNVKLLAEEDVRYAGKTVSRQSLDIDYSDHLGADDDHDISDDELDGEDEELDSDDVEQQLQLEYVNNDLSNIRMHDNDQLDMRYGSDEESLGSEQIDYDEESEDDGSGDESEDDDDYDESQYDLDISSFVKNNKGTSDDGEDGSKLDVKPNAEKDNSGIVFSKSRVDTDVKRGQAVQNQIRLWEALLELRIELQKLLHTVNQLPAHDLWHQITSSDLLNSQEISNDFLNKVQDTSTDLLGGFLTLQQFLENSQNDHAVSSRGVKRKLSDLESSITDQFATSQNIRNGIIQKWDDRTRLAGHKHKSGHSQSTLQQIEHILLDKQRLLTRTQQARNDYKIVGKTPDQSQLQVDTTADSDREKGQPHSQHHKSCDPEIFNDDDFYHTLLKELIEQRTAQSNDPTALSRQWLEFQALRKKIKRVVDTRASKGRKLRYNVMPKLVNFMAPISTVMEWEDDKRDELFLSLFGKKLDDANISR